MDDFLLAAQVEVPVTGAEARTQVQPFRRDLTAQFVIQLIAVRLNGGRGGGLHDETAGNIHHGRTADKYINGGAERGSEKENFRASREVPPQTVGLQAHGCRAKSPVLKGFQREASYDGTRSRGVVDIRDTFRDQGADPFIGLASPIAEVAGNFSAVNIQHKSQNLGQVVLDGGGDIRLVHGVDMNSLDAVGDKVDDLLRGVSDARLFHGKRIAAEFVGNGKETRREDGAGKFNRFINLTALGDGHDACQNGDGDADFTDAVEEAVKDAVVEEHLRRQEFAAGIHFAFQVLHVLLLRGGFGVPFGVAGAAHTEIAVFLDGGAETVGVFEPVLGRKLNAFRHIAAQREDILNVFGFKVIQTLMQHVPVAGHAGDMRKRSDAAFGLNVGSQLEGVTAGSAGGTESHAHEIRLQLRDLERRFLDFREEIIGFGRVHLERDGRFFLFQNISDLHQSCLSLSFISYVCILPLVFHDSVKEMNVNAGTRALCFIIEFPKKVLGVFMGKKQCVLLIAAVCILLGGIALINRDVMHWETAFAYKLALNPDEYTEDFYHWDTQDLVLKPGPYTLTLYGNLGAEDGARSSIKVDDSAGEILYQADFYGGVENKFYINIENHARKIGIHILYAPASGEIGVDKIKISSDEILYKASLLRHLTITVFFLLLWAFLTLRFVFPEQYRKCFPKIAKPETEVSFLLLVLLTLISCIPFFISDGLHQGDDIYYHLGTIRGISSSMADGYIPPRILLSLIENYGYGAGFYYPNFFLQFPAVLMLLGFSLVFSYKIFILLCTCFSLCSIYSCTKKISGKVSAARLSAVLYAFAAYRLVDVFYRAAVGEIQAFVFMPIIILGLYEIYEGHPEQWFHFALGFTGLLMCHMISLAICGVFTLAFVLIRFRKTFGDRRVFMALLKSVLLTLALGAFFILPMIEQMTTVELKINGIITSDITKAKIESFDGNAKIESFDRLFLFFDPWVFSRTSPRNVYPGLILLIIPLLRLIFVRKRTKAIVIADTLSLFGAAALIMCTNVFPWRRFLLFLSRIQFSWRIMMIATVCLCVSCAIYADSISSSKRFITAVVFGAAVCGMPIIAETVANRRLSLDEYLYQEKFNSLSGAEYLPSSFRREIAETNKDSVFSNADDYKITQHKRRGLTFAFSYEMNDGEDVYFTVPLVMYTGYRAELTAADGTVTELHPEADDVGLVRVYTGGVDSGNIFVHYEKTGIQIVSEIISLSALAFIIIARLYKKRNLR